MRTEQFISPLVIPSRKLRRWPHEQHLHLEQQQPILVVAQLALRGKARRLRLRERAAYKPCQSLSQSLPSHRPCRRPHAQHLHLKQQRLVLVVAQLALRGKGGWLRLRIRTVHVARRGRHERAALAARTHANEHLLQAGNELPAAQAHGDGARRHIARLEAYALHRAHYEEPIVAPAKGTAAH